MNAANNSPTGSRIDMTSAPEIPIADLEANAIHRLAGRMFKGFRRLRFRGSITDYCRTILLGPGYMLPAEPDAPDNLCRNCRAKGLTTCRHFEIDTCRQLSGPFKALEDENVWLVMLLKATQTLGSIAWDMLLHWLIVHSPYQKIKIFIDADEKARKYCDERLMPTLKSNPDISLFLPSGAARFDDRKTEIHFTNGKSIIICGLNESNASSLSADAVVIDEGWEHGSDGLMQKAIDRTKQVAWRKVFIVGQAGNVDEDQDRIWNGLHKRVPLTFACPCCGGRQEFNLTGARPDDFIPRPPLSPPPEILRDGGLPLPPSPPKPGTYWGLRTPKRFGELTSPEEIKSAANATVLECYWCGFEIPDTRAMRRALMDSYEQEYQANGVTPEKFTVGFWNPDPASVTIPFRQTMYEYIVATKANTELGNITPLQDFYKSRWARAWNPKLSSQRQKIISIGSYETDPENLSYGAATMRQITVDTGKSPESETNVIQIGQLFFEVRDFDNGAESLSRGASRQITRGMVQDFLMDTPDGHRRVSCWELLAAQQHYWHITNRHVLIDLGYAPSQVIEAAVKYHEIVDLNGRLVARENYGKQVDWASCWRGCQGSGDSRIGPNKKAFHESSIPGLQSTHDKSGRLRKISLSRIIWSNYVFEDQFERIVMLKTAAVGWEIIGQEKLVIVGLDGKPNAELTRKYIEFEQDKEGSGQFRSWVSGLNSRTLDDKKRKYIDNAKQAYAKGHWTEPRDCSLMQLVGAAAEGMLGHVATEE